MTNYNQQTPPPTPQLAPTIAPVHLRPAIVGQFIAIALIWSLTPLAAVWTVKEIHWAWGLFLRFSLASILAIALLYFYKIKLPLHRQALLSYSAGAVGLFGSMSVCYIGALYVPSAVISMIYGFAPLISGIICIVFLKHPWFSLRQSIGLGLALLGLGFSLGIGTSGLNFNALGVGLEFFAVLLYVLSALWVNHIGANIDSVAQMAGSTLMSCLGYLIILPFFPFTINWHEISLYAYTGILYSAIFSSVLAMVCYYALLKKIKTQTLMLITIITPILATLWGVWLNQEILGQYFFIGLIFICTGLYLYVSRKSSST